MNTHLFKGKFGYDITPELQAIFTVAYEDRSRNQNRPHNYVSQVNGQPFWGGPAPVCNSVPPVQLRVMLRWMEPGSTWYSVALGGARISVRR